jgi:hypothetical protein
MHDITHDFTATESAFKAAFADMPSRPLSENPIPNANFMTPDVLGIWKYERGWAELSTGIFGDDRLFGITIRTLDAGKGEIPGRMVDLGAKTMEDVRKEYDEATKPLGALVPD